MSDFDEYLVKREQWAKEEDTSAQYDRDAGMSDYELKDQRLREYETSSKDGELSYRYMNSAFLDIEKNKFKAAEDKLSAKDVKEREKLQADFLKFREEHEEKKRRSRKTGIKAPRQKKMNSRIKQIKRRATRLRNITEILH